MNVSRKSSQMNALFNTNWSKAQKPSQNSMARLRLKSYLVPPWHPSRASTLRRRGSRCFDAPARATAPVTLDDNQVEKICKLRYLRNLFGMKFPKKACLFAHNRTIMLPKYWGETFILWSPSSKIIGEVRIPPSLSGIHTYSRM